jgi:hypothetical protein
VILLIYHAIKSLVSGVFNYFAEFIDYVAYNAVYTDNMNYIPEFMLDWILRFNEGLQEAYNRHDIGSGSDSDDELRYSDFF